MKDKFSQYKNPFTESFELELDSRNEEVIVIISHDLEGVEKAPLATVQARKSDFRRDLL